MAFGSSKKENISRIQSSSSQSVFAKDLSVKGDVVCPGSLRVEGKIEGSIKGKGIITIAEASVTKADIDATKVVVLGQVEGNITATEIVEIVASGKVYGDITTDKFSVEEGAVFTGKCVTKTLEKKEIPQKEEPKTTDLKSVQK